MKKIFLLLFFLTFQFANSQDLGKVTIEELKKTKSLIDTSAVAEVMFSYGTTYFIVVDGNYNAVTEISTKIKIFKKEGLKYANVSFPLYNQRNKAEKMSITNAITYNLVNGKIEKSKLKSSEEFLITENENLKIKKIVLPNVKEGSIIEYKSKITTPFIWNLNTWNFQLSIPVLESVYKFTPVEEIRYQHFIKGFYQVDVVNNSTHFLYKLSNIKPIKEEAWVNNIENYRSSLRLEISQYEKSSGLINSVSDSWDSLVKNIFKGEFGEELNRTRYFNDDLKSLFKGNENRDEKVKIIFNYVQTNFKWNGKYGYNPDLGVREAYKNKTGNIADINLVLIAMLKEAGISANPILMSTRNHGIALHPSHSAFNYVIAAVEILDEVILLDATSKFSKPNILPTRALNWFGRIIRENGSSTLVTINTKDISTLTTLSTINLDENGNLEGFTRKRYNNNYAFNYRDQYYGYKNEAISKKYQSKYNGLEIDGFELKNMNLLDENIDEIYNFELKNAADVIGDQIFFEPTFIFELKSNPFIDSDRKYPVDFIFSRKEIANYIVNIPDGYEIEYLPKSIHLKTSSDKYTLKWLLTSEKNKISLRISEEILDPIFSAEEYNELKLLFDDYEKIQNEKIVLKKIK